MKPILFNTEMVRAILDGRKTCTRRVIKPQPRECLRPVDELEIAGSSTHIETSMFDFVSEPYKRGDVLYVRETWKEATACPSGGGYDVRDYYLYKADEPQDTSGMMVERKWHPSIHMPKEAARIFLRVTNVRVERLQDIDEEGVCAEGAEPLIGCRDEHGVIEPDGTLGDMCYNTGACGGCPFINKSYGEMFGEKIWNPTVRLSERRLYGWEANPWVWVIEFESISEKEAKA